MKYTIQPLDPSLLPDIQHNIDQKTKPPGSLGQLEELATQVALIQEQEKLAIVDPTMLIFAGDHGIAEQGISIAPSEVTAQMVANFLAGGAAINCLCRTNNMAINVIDAGIKQELPDSDQLIKQRLGNGTQDFSIEPAMSKSTAEKGIQLGSERVQTLAERGCNTVGFGEMGIGNTSSAAAILAAITGLSAEQCVGRGTGINDEQLQKKRRLIETALNLHKEQLASPVDILAALGGFEIAQIVGGMLAAAEKRMLILVDGFIVTAAALLAVKMQPTVRDYMVFCHHSVEPGHQKMLTELNAKPFLDLGLRLGEGTGAALALPLVRAACSFYNDMASFEDAGVTV